MAESNLTIDYATIRREVGRLLGYQRDPTSWGTTRTNDVKDIIDAGLRKFTYPTAVGRREMAHRWSFLFQETILTVKAPYGTGTIEVVDGVVTLTGGTFPTWTGTAHLLIGNAEYEINTRDGNTQVTLIDTTLDVDAGTEYQWVQWIYGLPDDFSALTTQITYEPRNTYPWVSLQMTDSFAIHNFRQPRPIPRRPIWCALRVQAPALTTKSTRYELMLAPTPDAAYTFRYKYEVIPYRVDSTYIYYRGGTPHAETIREAILSQAEATLNDTVGLHERLYQERLAASVSHDLMSSTPATLGHDVGVVEDFLPAYRHGPNYSSPTYNGIVQ